jgi:hypothetical protein
MSVWDLAGAAMGVGIGAVYSYLSGYRRGRLLERKWWHAEVDRVLAWGDEARAAATADPEDRGMS